MSVTVGHVTLEAPVQTWSTATGVTVLTASSGLGVRLSSGSVHSSTHVHRMLFVLRNLQVRYFDFFELIM